MSVAAVILAAGRSTRMGRNKLLHPLDAAGGDTLLARAADAALASCARPVVVVLGHEAAAARGVLADRPVVVVENPDHAAGLSTSLRCGLAALPPESNAAMVLLADMPGVDAPLLDRLVDASGHGDIVVPVRDGRRGNPVLWPRRFFPALATVAGDRGGRDLLHARTEAVREVPVAGDGAFLDLDTPAALAAWLSRPAAGGG